MEREGRGHGGLRKNNLSKVNLASSRWHLTRLPLGGRHERKQEKKEIQFRRKVGASPRGGGKGKAIRNIEAHKGPLPRSLNVLYLENTSIVIKLHTWR